MKNRSMEVLIITRSVAMQQGLGALLESMPEVTSVKAIKELTSSYPWIELHQPRIVLLDIALLGNDPRNSLEKIQVLSPQTQRILLVDQVSDVQWVPQYAEAILIKGAPPSSVATIVSNLLLSDGDEYEHNDSNKSK
jgi:DNA-binding NarL/FixJ family response regulator